MIGFQQTIQNALESQVSLLGRVIFLSSQGDSLRMALQEGECDGEVLYRELLCASLRGWLGRLFAEEEEFAQLGQFLRDPLQSSPRLAQSGISLVIEPLDEFSADVWEEAIRTGELGRVFEGLLSWHIQIHWSEQQMRLAQTAGHTRKTSGSYYTPPLLVDTLLDELFAPMWAEIADQSDLSSALLGKRICDPSCGVGHFLVAACKQLAARLDTSPLQALQQVLMHCIYGVDIHPVAVELCKLQLWLLGDKMPGLAARLHHAIRCGNSLFGTSEEALQSGISEQAFLPIEGDHKPTTTALRRSYRKLQKQRQNQKALDSVSSASSSSSFVLEQWDLWCATFVWPKTPQESDVLEGIMRDISHGDAAPSQKASVRRYAATIAQEYGCFHWERVFPEVFGEGRGGFDAIVGNPPWERMKLQEVEWFAPRKPEIALAKRAVTRQQMIADLAQSQPALSQAFLHARRRAEGMSHFVRHCGRYPLSGRGDVNFYTCFVELSMKLIHKHGVVGLLVPSGIATDHTTQELFRALMESHQLRALYDFENAERYFSDVSERMRFCLLLLQGPQRMEREAATFVFFARKVEDIHDQDRRFSLSIEQLRLLNPNTQTCPIFRSRRDAELTLSMARRIPILMKETATSADFVEFSTELSEKPKSRAKKTSTSPGAKKNHGIPAQSESNSTTPSEGSVRFLRMFDVTNDSRCFLTVEELERKGARRYHNRYGLIGGDKEFYYPLFEGKMFEQYDHRFADVVTTQNLSRPGQPVVLSEEDHRDPHRIPSPQYWVSEREIQRVLADFPKFQWFLGFKDVTSPTNRRTCIATILPYCAVANSVPLLFLPQHDGPLAACYCAAMNSFVLDYLARQKISSLHLNFFIVKQLPFLPVDTFFQPCPWEPKVILRYWIAQRALALLYTSWDLQEFAQDCDYWLEPFPWDLEMRWEQRIQLDAAFFLLYGISAEEADYILDTFPIVRKKELQQFGEYRSKREILAMMSEFLRCQSKNSE